MAHYLALDCDANTDAQLQCLTPSVMQWEPGNWVMALQPALPYWQAVVQNLPNPISLMTVWKRRLVESCFPKLKPPSTPFEWERLPVRAVWAFHPFVALLMMSHMKHSDQFGWVVAGSTRFHHVWHRLTWATWESTVKTCLAHWDRCRPTGFTLSKGRQGLTRLLRVVHRLGLSKPADLHRLPIDGIRRRFGPWMAYCCDWTRLAPTDTRYFPWQQWRAPVVIQCDRYLDDPTHDWQTLAGVLCEDLDSLASQLTGGITTMVWRIRFETDEWLPFPIQFRHPHFAQREQGTHSTILRQCQAALSQFNQRHVIKWMPRVTGWQLEVTSQLQVAPNKLTLFDFEPDRAQESELAKLENAVLVPLHRFTRLAHWTPGDDWAIGTQIDPPWQVIHNGESRHAPLFFWQRPHRIQGQPPVRASGTLTTLIPWWRGTKPEWDRWYAPRLCNGQWHWAYWDGTSWWSVGIYG